MAKLTKLDHIDKTVLADLRMRLGADDPDDTSRDAQIAGMNADALFDNYCAWHLGNSGWGQHLRGIYAMLKKAEGHEVENG